MSATTGKTGGGGACGGVVPRLCLAAFVRKGKFIARNTEGSHESEGGAGHPGCICVCIVRSLSFKKICPLFEPWLAKNVTLYLCKCQKSQNGKIWRPAFIPLLSAWLTCWQHHCFCTHPTPLSPNFTVRVVPSSVITWKKTQSVTSLKSIPSL